MLLLRKEPAASEEQVKQSSVFLPFLKRFSRASKQDKSTNKLLQEKEAELKKIKSTMQQMIDSLKHELSMSKMESGQHISQLEASVSRLQHELEQEANSHRAQLMVGVFLHTARNRSAHT